MTKQTKKVLNNISFSIEPNDFISIVGPTGCGKTTLLRIIAGFDNNWTGIIKIKNVSGKEINQNERLGKIGFIPQNQSLFPWLNLEDNIRFGLKIHNIPLNQQEKRISGLLEIIGLEFDKKSFPKELSGGMSQKVAICRALAKKPETNLILMDEPFSALDSQTRNKMQEELLNIWKKENLSIVFVTHNINEAIFLSKKVIVLSQIPAYIKYQTEISLSHPRDRTSIEFNQISKNLLDYIQE